MLEFPEELISAHIRDRLLGKLSERLASATDFDWFRISNVIEKIRVLVPNRE
jgi:hypothetical protein